MCLSTNKSKHHPVIKNFQNSERSRTELKMSLQFSSRFHILYFKENISCKRIRVLFLARNLWGIRIFRTDRRGCVCLIEANWSRVKIAVECMKICSHRTKQEWYHLLTSTGQESNNQSSKQELKSSSNLLIFLVCLFFVCCFVLTSRIWCFRCLLSYLQGFNFNRDYQCSMSSEIHNLQLKFTFFL